MIYGKALNVLNRGFTHLTDFTFIICAQWSSLTQQLNQCDGRQIE